MTWEPVMLRKGYNMIGWLNALAIIITNRGHCISGANAAESVHGQSPPLSNVGKVIESLLGG